MTPNSFIIEDYYELLALHRTFLEAKFCDKPNDFDVSWSPIAANLHRGLIKVLVYAAVQKHGDSARTDWNTWLSLSESRREWNIALERARTNSEWKNWNDNEKRNNVTSLLAPFHTPDELVTKFIEQV